MSTAQNSRHERIKSKTQNTLPPGGIAPTKARIHSAIAKGKQTVLPCETKGLKLSKFEHKGRDGPLVIFAEEVFQRHGKVGHYKVVTAAKVAESVHNQLFFGEELSKHNKQVVMTHRSSVSDRSMKDGEQINREISVDRRGKRWKKNSRKQLSNPDSFEELLARYKSRRAKNKDLMGAEHLDVLEKLGGLYRQRKQERLKLLALFGNLGDIRTKINASTGLRDHVKDLEDASEEDRKEELVKLPRIRVTTVTELTKKNSMRKLDRKRLAAPREKRGPMIPARDI